MTWRWRYTKHIMVAVKAFYYEGRYYLLPAQDSSVAQFRSRLYDGVSLELTELCQVRCMAPHFTMDNFAQRLITIKDCRRIYPVDAYVMPAKEYDERLGKIVEDKCPGCMRYENDSSDLSGHHQEVSLSGQCLEREEGVMKEGLLSPYEPAYAVEDFWFGFVRIETDLRTCIDKGDFMQAVAQMSGLLAEVEMQEYVFPALSRYVYLDSKGNSVTRYVLMLTGGGIPCAELIAHYFIRRMPPILAHRWDIYPYAVRGFYTQSPLFTGWNPEIDPPLLQVTYLEQQDLFAVRMFVQWDDEEIPANIYCANYMYLCQIIGEERLRGAVLEIMPFPKSEMVFEGDCVTAQEFSDRIDEQIRDKVRLTAERCSLRNLDMEGMQEQRKVSHLTTYCEQLSFDFILGFEGPSLYLWDGEISLGTLFVPGHRLVFEDDLEYISSLIRRALYECYYAESIDVCTGPDGVYFDFIVFHKVNVRKALRSLAPILRAFEMEYTERLGEEMFSYKVDFDMEIPEC